MDDLRHPASTYWSDVGFCLARVLTPKCLWKEIYRGNARWLYWRSLWREDLPNAIAASWRWARGLD